jgi:hypothetical protein
MQKTKFTWREWQYTNADESLFDLSKDELEIFRLLIEEAK